MGAGIYFEVPLDQLVTPREGDTMVQRYWGIGENGGALFWRRNAKARGVSPQCNGDRRVIEKMPKSVCKDIQLVPVAFLGHWDEEQGHILSWFKPEG